MRGKSDVIIIKTKNIQKGSLNSKKFPENLLVGSQVFYEAMVKFWHASDANEHTYSALNI